MKKFEDFSSLADKNVIKLGKREGHMHQISSLRFTWKARGEDTGYEFSVFELPLAPGLEVPLHTHPSAEMIYVLEGEASYKRLLPDGAEEWVTCTPGECVVAPPMVPHGEANRSDKPARVLSISTYYHQQIFDGFGNRVENDDPVPPFDPKVFTQFFEKAEQFQCYLVEPAAKS